MGRGSGPCPSLTTKGTLKGQSGSRAEADSISASDSKPSLIGTFSKEHAEGRSSDPEGPSQRLWHKQGAMSS